MNFTYNEENQYTKQIVATLIQLDKEYRKPYVPPKDWINDKYIADKFPIPPLRYFKRSEKN